MLTTILQPTSSFSTSITRLLVRLFLAFRRHTLHHLPHPHDALATLPARLASSHSDFAIHRASFPLPTHWPDAHHWNPLILTPKHIRTKRTIIYLHGGAFLHPLSPAHWYTIARLSHDLDADVAVQTYPLLPHAGAHHVVPKLLQVYRHVLAAAIQKRHELILAGDSAGGNLAAALTLAARDAALQLPQQLLLISPVLDLNLDRPDIRTIQPRDPWLKMAHLGHLARFWALGGTDAQTLLHTADKPLPEADDATLQALAHPYASPNKADWSFYKGHITLICGTADILFADAQVLAQKAQDSELDLTFIRADGCVHVYPILAPFVPFSWLLARDSRRGFELMVQSVLRRYSA
ncbi:hypothetical protein ACQY0O_005524 [Thecaphora frezii]